MSTTLIVDAQNLLRRCLFGQTPLTRSDGMPVGAVQNFLLCLLDLIDEYDVVRGACVFDGPGRSHRRIAVDSYKAMREAQEENDGDAWQRAMMRVAARAVGLAVIDGAPYEADDVIATLVTRDRGRCVVASDDKDLMHLTSIPNVRMHQFRDDALVGPRMARVRWGVDAARIPDVQMLMGDAGDGVPGLRGVGKKQAALLVEKYGSPSAALCDIPTWGGKRWIEWCAGAMHARTMRTAVMPVCDANVHASAKSLHPRWRENAAGVLLALECDRNLRVVCRRYRIRARDVEANAVIAADQSIGADPLPHDIFDNDAP